MSFDAGIFFRFLIAALATWRVAFLVARERGPYQVFARLRGWAGHGAFADLLTCVKCVGLWVAIPFAFFVRGDWAELIVVWLALAGVTALIDESTRPPFEWAESDEEQRIPRGHRDP